MENYEIETKLIARLKELFSGSFELGGGKEFRYFHSVGVYKLAKKIVKTENLKINSLVLMVATLFHDVEKTKAVKENGLLDYECEGNLDHDQVTSQKLLKYVGDIIDDKNILIEASIIISQSHRKPVHLGAKILRDADEIGNIGYLQVWRIFTYSALDKRNIEELIHYWKDQGKRAVEEMIKLLHFKVTKRVATKRFYKLCLFMEELEKEFQTTDFL